MPNSAQNKTIHAKDGPPEKRGTSNGYMPKGRLIPEVSKREENKVMKSIAKTGEYKSPAMKIAEKKQKADYDKFDKERNAQHKRDGISD